MKDYATIQQELLDEGRAALIKLARKHEISISPSTKNNQIVLMLIMEVSRETLSNYLS